MCIRDSYETIRDYIEVLAVVAPDLDIAWANDISEVTLPIHLLSCTELINETADQYCNTSGPSGSFSDQWGSGNLATGWGFIRISDQPYGSRHTLTHEFGHAMGLWHSGIDNTSMGPPNTQQGYWAAHDLMSVALIHNPLITSGQTREEIQTALNIQGDDELLSFLYSKAFALVNTSRYEGFGITNIEAMQLGCPVISSDFKALKEIGASPKVIAAGFLHDVVEDTKSNLKDIEQNFGDEISYLVDGVTKLSRLEGRSDKFKQAENFRKLLISSSNDIRVLLVKLADRLHNIRTIDGLKNENKKQKICKETLEIYAPLAERLGIEAIQNELEDKCFQIINPETK